MCLAIPGRVVRFVEAELPTAEVAFGAILKPICLALVPEVQVGDFVLAHVGFAITRLDELEAQRTLAALGELGDLTVLNQGSKS
ncbi:MAG TPA: HypC/HybG/HupF family hydrogenase formation chaperone [Polyangiaceae bacterium]|jgi:hydrogenase expression/formation protein HypC|nr:HypC/HybG/HupF family hydrogenase formation chaperone [Polyangiaceae bacterium]